MTCHSAEGMKRQKHQKLTKQRQYLITLLAISSVAGMGLLLHDFLGYRVVAFMLLVTVSVLAMFLDIVPVLLAALLSALCWDFLFIPPRFTFTVGTSEDSLLLLMYFVIALIHAVLTFKIREMQRQVLKKEEKEMEARLYTTLFNSLSHELRTPITTILGSTDNLLSNSENLSEENRKELLNEISTASMRLNRQVENLLNMSRLESGGLKLKKDWCDVRELIYTTLQRFEGSLRQHKLSILISDILPLFKLDFGLMEQVLHNLISNAIHHTPADSRITVQAMNEEEKLVITIADTGKGFPEGEIEKVFNKFYRLQDTHAGGTGLGLSIAKGLVEAHGGSITLKNLPLSGALFTIKIPTEVSYLNNLKNE